jgi:hypothetical protein
MDDVRIWVVICDGESARICSTSDGTTAIVPPPPFADPFAGALEGNPIEKAWFGHAKRGFLVRRGPKEQFARHIAQILFEAAREQSYDGLILIAAPEIEAELRRALAPETEARLLGEIIRDLPFARPVEADHAEGIRH